MFACLPICCVFRHIGRGTKLSRGGNAYEVKGGENIWQSGGGKCNVLLEKKAYGTKRAAFTPFWKCIAIFIQPFWQITTGQSGQGSREQH